MEEKKLLAEEELDNVTGGIDIGQWDDCHFTPSHYVNAMYGNTDGAQCGTCLYNRNRGWKESTCDYPTKYPYYW